MDQAVLLQFIIAYPLLLFALSFHEAAHALAASWGGDLTAAYQGRITLNPLSHIDPIGTVFMPFAGAMTGAPLIGWARPVPFVETNFQRRNWGVVVALAGPFSNILLVFIGALLMHAIQLLTMAFGEYAIVASNVEVIRGGLRLLQLFVQINAALAVFNMIPFPPLDGSHVLWYCFVRNRPQWHALFFRLQSISLFLLMGLFLIPGFRMLISVGIWGVIKVADHLTSLGM